MTLTLDNILEYNHNILEAEGERVKTFCTNDLQIYNSFGQKGTVTCYSLLFVSKQGNIYTIVPKGKRSISKYLIDWP